MTTVAWALLTWPALAALPWVASTALERAEWVSRATGRTEATIVRYAEWPATRLFGAAHCPVVAFTTVTGERIEVQSRDCDHGPVRRAGSTTTVRFVPDEPHLADREALLARGAFVWGELAALTVWVTGVSALCVSVRRLVPGARVPAASAVPPVASTDGQVIARLPFSRVGAPPPAVSATTVSPIVGSPTSQQEES